MTDDGVDEFVTAMRSLAELLERDEVAAAWTKASVLPGYTVGGIAGHVVSLLQGLQGALAHPLDQNLALVPFTDWYGRPSSGDRRGDVARPLVDIGDAIAAQGKAEVAAKLRVVAGALEPLLRAAHEETSIPLLSLPGSGVRLCDYLRTRVAEIAIHAQDIAASATITVAMPEQVWCTTRDVLLETLTERLAPQDIVRKLARPKLAEDIELRAF